MINILLEGYGINEKWLYNELKQYIKSDYSVTIIAFSFRDSIVKSESDWNKLYGKRLGKYYNGIVDGFRAYGISEDNIKFVNYFTDTKESAVNKILNADIIYFPGGLPDRMMDRIIEFDLYDTLMNYNGIVMGYSAGAVIQLSEYHLTPDDDYSEFAYYKGLPYLKNLYIEIHYENTDLQKQSINKVISERNKTLYAISHGSGAIIIDNGVINLIGNVKTFHAK